VPADIDGAGGFMIRKSIVLVAVAIGALCSLGVPRDADAQMVGDSLTISGCPVTHVSVSANVVAVNVTCSTPPLAGYPNWTVTAPMSSPIGPALMTLATAAMTSGKKVAFTGSIASWKPGVGQLTCTSVDVFN
jgi:hypothetical protein